MSINNRNRELALHHATLLQQRKDVESDVLAAIEELIDLPTDPVATTSDPASVDLDRFIKLIAPFQISDYDALIDERNAAGKCGYVFCRNPLKRESASSGSFSRIVRGNPLGTSTKDREFRVVPNSKFDMWCSKWCARRALYIKLQLSEVPAWERAASMGNDVELLDHAIAVGGLPAKMEKLSLEKGREEEVRKALANLALERGERTKNWPVLPAMPPMPAMTLRERTSVGMPSAPQLGEAGSGSEHAEIEGYAPRSSSSQDAPQSGDVDWHLE